MEELSTIPPELIPSSDRVLAPSTSMEHFASSRRGNERIHIAWKNLEFTNITKDKSKSTLFNTVYSERKILNGLNGEVSNGDLLAVLGPTGCGKSSFLNVMAARVPSGNNTYFALEGSILINGKPRNDEQFRNISAYMQQDDHLYAFLTVYETLLLAAHFYLPPSLPLDKKIALVESVIGDLSLKKARDTIIGNDKIRGISGGERRRTSIALQMLTDPLVLFLDEPTSGLDAFQAQSVMEALKLLSNLGRLVVAVIHQPRSSIFNMFDKLLLLSEGRTMYIGDAVGAVHYFSDAGYRCPENFNPSDFFLDILSPDARTIESDEQTADRIKRLGDLWESKPTRISTEELEELGSMKDVRKVGEESTLRTIKNFQLLCWRTFAQQTRDIGTLRARFLFVIFFGFLIGGIYSNIGNSQRSIQNRNGVLFFVIINQVFNTLFAVVSTFPLEKYIVNRERSGRAYNTLSYFIAKVFVELPLNVIPSMIYSCIVYWLVGLNPRPGRFPIFIFVLALVNFTAVAFALNVSVLVPTPEAASALATPLIIIAILFGGFYISIGNLPIVADWIPYFSIFRWGYEALAINEYRGLKFDCSGLSDLACIHTGEQELAIQTLDGHTVSYGVFGLGMLLLGFLAGTFFFLLRSKVHFIQLGHIGREYAAYAVKKLSYAPVTSSDAVMAEAKDSNRL